MDVSRVIVVLPNWIGDVVMATPALRALRAHFRNAHITYVLRPYVADVVNELGLADEILEWPAGKTAAKRRHGVVWLAQQIRNCSGGRPDVAVLLANSFRAALLATLAGARRRVGYDRDGRGLLLSDRLVADRVTGRYVPGPMVRYYNSIASFLGCTEMTTDLSLPGGPEYDALFDVLCAKTGITDHRPLVVVHPGAAFGESKCWMPERFSEVSDRLVESHGVQVVFTCGPNERKIIGTIRERLQKPAVVLDESPTTLREVMALIRRSDLLICNDTGPRHFAAAYGVPVVTLFGPTDPRWSETNFALERKVMVSVDCGPCQKPVCPLDHRCMTGIDVEAVLKPAGDLLAMRCGA